MRVMLACRSINQMAGGVERQIIVLANELSNRNHSVSLFTFDENPAKAFYRMASSVHWYKLGMGNPTQKAPWFLRFKRMKKIRKIMREFGPDALVAFQPGVFVGLKFYGLGLNIPMIAAIRNAPSIFDFTTTGKKKKWIYRLLRMADKVTVQFSSYRDGLPSFLRNRTRVIPNAIEAAKEYACPEKPFQGEWTLLAVGRLSFQKNYHLLIGAFGKLMEKFSGWTLVIAGEGSEYERLEKTIATLGRGDRIKLLGNVDKVEKLYGHAHLFCQPSLWEGFPNSLSEALAHGLPAVGFARCSGVNELIRHRENGLLVENGNTEEECMELLTRGLEELMMSPGLRKSMGKNAVESMRPYHPKRCFDEWERVLGEVV